MADQDPSRGEVSDDSIITLDNDTLALTQKGLYKRPSFFGDMTQLSEYDDFIAAVGTAMNYSGSRNNDIVEEREEDQFLLTSSEIREIERLARNIATYGDVKFDCVRTFLIILCYIDDIDDMIKIANTLEIEELKNENILQKPGEILEIKDLYKIAFIANALDALINIYSKYLPKSNTTSKKTEAGDVLQNFMSIIGGTIGSGVLSKLEIPDANEALGHFMSELLSGQRIPTTIIAKNPMKQSPSYSGQTMFGESPNPLGLVDITEDFAKKIAVFPKPVNGAGKSSFNLQNFSKSMGLQDVINELLFDGGTIKNGSYKANAINSVVEKVKANTGIKDNEILDVKYADTGLPLQIELSAVLCGTDKTPFGSGIFQQGWELSCAISNYMQANNPDFLKAIRENEA